MILFLFLIVCLVTTVSSQHTGNIVHLPGCGCTTTTTCSPEVGTSSCPSGSPRPGKRGPVGPKGEKGAPVKSNEMRITQLQSRFDQLNDDLKVFWELSYSFPSACSEYIRHEAEHRKFERVPLYLGKSTRNMTAIIANCTRVEEIRGPASIASIDVPFNSVLGRTLILKGTPKKGGDYNVFRVRFVGDDESFVLHVAVRFSWAGIPEKQTLRNDRTGSTEWHAQEPDTLIDFPFHIGVPFTMKITVDEVGYHCYVDGNKLFVFNHREMPLSKIKTVDASGDLSIAFMSFN